MKKSKSKAVRKAPVSEWNFLEETDGTIGHLIVEGRHCCVYTKWDSNILHILLFNYEVVKAWLGTVTDDEIAGMASSLQMSVEEFKQETKTALQPRPSSAPSYQYTLEDGVFAWKKVVSEGIQFDFGSANVCETSTEKAISFFFSKLLHSNEALIEELEQVKRREEQLQKERRMLLQRCEGYVSGKEKAEADLYSRFAAVLNAKKSRISELKSAPTSNGSSSEEEQGMSGEDGRKSKRRKLQEGGRPNEKSESDAAEVYDEETDVDTDEERELENERRKRKKIS